MAKSQAASQKDEKEKQRLLKRKEKEQRKEERRKASEGKSFEDMLAYVDADGNITSTPPDPAVKRDIKAEDIVIGARNRSDDDKGKEVTVRKGRVTFFNTSKGYGFIKDDDTQESIFVHVNALASPVGENDKVTFEVERTPRGLSAVRVKKL